jgi:hypothetical protein
LDLCDLCVLLLGSPFRPVVGDFCTEDRKGHKDRDKKNP